MHNILKDIIKIQFANDTIVTKFKQHKIKLFHV